MPPSQTVVSPAPSLQHQSDSPRPHPLPSPPSQSVTLLPPPFAVACSTNPSSLASPPSSLPLVSLLSPPTHPSPPRRRTRPRQREAHSLQHPSGQTEGPRRAQHRWTLHHRLRGPAPAAWIMSLCIRLILPTQTPRAWGTPRRPTGVGRLTRAGAYPARCPTGVWRPMPMTCLLPRSRLAQGCWESPLKRPASWRQNRHPHPRCKALPWGACRVRGRLLRAWRVEQGLSRGP